MEQKEKENEKRELKSRDIKTESLITTEKRRGDFQVLSLSFFQLKLQKKKNWANGPAKPFTPNFLRTA